VSRGEAPSVRWRLIVAAAARVAFLRDDGVLARPFPLAAAGAFCCACASAGFFLLAAKWSSWASVQKMGGGTLIGLATQLSENVMKIAFRLCPKLPNSAAQARNLSNFRIIGR